MPPKKDQQKEQQQKEQQQKEHQHHHSPIIAIDFGTHYACVGVMKNDRVEICPNQQGNRTTPAVVAFVNDDKLVGDEAKGQIDRNPQNTVYDIKKLLGRRADDAALQADAKKLPFKVVGETDKVAIEVAFKGKQVQVSPVEIATLILQQIKTTAENFVGVPVKRAVMTVPSEFNEDQRKSLRDAATAAGLTVIRFINEHSAVALAYGLDQTVSSDNNNTNGSSTPPNNNVSSGNQRVLVFDLGGSGLQVSVLGVVDATIETLSNVDDHTLSGEAFDAALTKHFVAEFSKKYRGCDITESARSMSKLKSASEKAKRNLSNMPQASLELDSLYDGRDFFTSISRARFEDLVGDLVRGCRRTIESALSAAKTSRDQIERIIMVGGGSRMPIVQSVITDFFGAKVEVLKNISPEEVVCYGATLQAHLMSLHGSSVNEKKVANGAPFSMEALPSSIGVEDALGRFVPVLPARTRLPAVRTLSLTNEQDNQKHIHLSLHLQTQDATTGASIPVTDCTPLARFIFDIVPAPRGTSKLQIKIEVDNAGVMVCSLSSRVEIVCLPPH
ncbi:hypothetical protein SAMD00019534_124660 [Acytostelium subglobosum LB1]|uniref:hypothetical protein n=1 Tax=Acytostelium subglobosum LB1 TaxID=1410327 RepID=UPI0006449419|nr:hypothetical protein SAMD00019534_124660 [Acytostelium subglobosum LB1]GAM29290.1 hypothetical protein SAMD00019534_124660 [Acytostelium subglobosum LB1]|eukprot:XP_012747788.1 hypothetical protein SAMD00019534_124660 [Acytostelium subglobosum LB1]